ncbi:MAG TPA: hypothetical protein VFK78_03515, partial [Gemmatimonadales bacterium]|nr:hypothetical protein [Gemmatimonadales bacterium]
SLIRWGAYDLVRVGKPPRVEFATWRYGERLKARQRERLKYVIPIGLAAVGLVVAVNVALGGSVGGFAWQFSRLADGTYVWLVGNRLVTLAEPPICERCGSVLHLRARHIQQARLVPHAHEDLALVVTCPKCGSEATMLTGDDAGQALRQGLTYLNTKGKRKKAADAARVVDAAGGPDQLIRDTSRRELTLRSLASERRLALEMSLDEAAEVRELERRWREAEEIAEIADGTLSTDPRIEEELKRLRQRDDGRPPQA